MVIGYVCNGRRVGDSTWRTAHKNERYINHQLMIISLITYPVFILSFCKPFSFFLAGLIGFARLSLGDQYEVNRSFA